jgi:DNA ligase (NAD+)
MKPAEIAALTARLTAAAHAYHNGLPLLMSDAEFDAGVDTLRDAAPTHPFLVSVGAPVAAGDEVALPVPLPSLNKIKAGDGSLTKWVGKQGTATHYHISVKLDGCSALWIPAERKLYTRGDGMKGRDISAFVPYFKGFPSPSGDSGPAMTKRMIRGELIMRTDSPAIPAGKLARNIVAGALNRKTEEPDPALFREIRFVAYENVAPANMRPAAAYELLRDRGYETAQEVLLPAAELTESRLSALFSELEAASAYQLDGIVVAPNVPRPADWTPEVRKGQSVNPADRVAWKTRLTANTATTTVRAVEWNVSHGGFLIPRVLFDTVTLAGANIGAATGLHGRWIYENKVGPGARIEVRRAGDVIPQIVAVHVAAPAGPAMPSAFLWDGPADSAIHIKPAGDEHAAASAIAQLTHALSELGAENVGPGVVAKLYAAGFMTLGAIYGATATEFAARVEGCKDKSAERIWTGLRAKQSVWTELDLLVASCTMPRGVSRSKLQPLLALNPTPATWSAAAFKSERPAGLSPATIDAIVEAIPAYLAWRAANIRSSVTVSVPKPPTVAAAGAGASATTGPQYTVVLTGFRDKELETQLAAGGHVVADTVTKKTTHVLYPDGPKPTTTKITKAEAAGVTALSVSAFRALLF